MEKFYKGFVRNTLRDWPNPSSHIRYGRRKDRQIIYDSILKETCLESQRTIEAFEDSQNFSFCPFLGKKNLGHMGLYSPLLEYLQTRLMDCIDVSLEFHLTPCEEIIISPFTVIPKGHFWPSTGLPNFSIKYQRVNILNFVALWFLSIEACC